jgi:pyridoxal phosphate enzyme (YggS family)
MTVIKDNIRSIRHRIETVAIRTGRKPERILLVAVTKTQSADKVDLALQAGITDFGENKVQEAEKKVPLVTEPYIGFHFIGHLQTNKVKAILKLKPCLIHSVDSFHLAMALSAALEGQDYKQDILIEVNTSGEGSKSGVEPNQLMKLAQEIAMLPRLQIKGLMTIGRLSERAEDSRQDFRLLKTLADELRAANIPKLDMKWLSMGMTNDFEIAIEEGANLVRIGSAIFGERHYIL